MASPAPRTTSGSKDYHIFGSRIVPFVAPKRDRNHIRFGSKADIHPPSADVRFTPKSGHWNSTAQCPLCAKSGLMRLQQKRRYSIAGLFDHFVSMHKERFGDVQVYSLRSLQIHDQLELDRHLYRKISWLCPTKNLVDVGCGLPIRIGGDGPVGKETAVPGKKAVAV